MIGYTDVIQVIVLVSGGLLTTYLALDLIAKEFSNSSVFGAFYAHQTGDSHFHAVA